MGSLSPYRPKPKYPGSSAIFNLYDGLAGSDVLVDEIFSAR